MSSLPHSLLTRIAAYPVPVQRVLAREIDPDLITRFLADLHGETAPGEARIASLMERPMLADTLLSRLIDSPRLAERMAPVLDHLRALPAEGSAAGPVRAIDLFAIDAFLAPLADPEAPYLSKLGELARAGGASGPGRPTPWQARAVAGLAAIHHATRASPASGAGIGMGISTEPGTALARLMRAAARGAPGAPEALAALAEPLEAPVRFAPPEGEAFAAPSLLRRYARARVAAARMPPLSGLDRRALGPLAADPGERDAEGIIRLHPPVPLALGFEGAPDESARRHLEALHREGLLDRDAAESAEEGIAARAGWQPRVLARRARAQIRGALRPEGAPEEASGEAPGETARRDAARLVLPGWALPTPLSLARLATAGLGGGERALRVPPGARSWRQEARMPPALEPASTAPAGRLIGAPGSGLGSSLGSGRDRSGLPAGAPLFVALRRSGESAWDAARGVSAVDAAAFVVRLEEGAAPAGWTGLDGCRLVEGTGRAALAALAAELRAGAFDGAVRKKPVLLIGRDTPDRPDWITAALARHWAHGAQLPASPVALDFEPAEGRFTIAPAERPALTRMMVAATASLPLAALAETGGAETGGAETGGAETGGTDGLPAWLDWLEQGLLLFGGRPGEAGTPFGIVAPGPGSGAGYGPGAPLPPEAFLPLARRIAPDRIGDALHAAAMQAGQVTRALAEADPARHWAVERLLAAATDRTRQIEALAAGVAEAPSRRNAARLIDLVEAPGTDRRAILPALDRVAPVLAARADILAALDEAQAAAFLEQARHLPSCDRVAAALALAGPQILAGRTPLMLPLVECLATGLEPADLQTALAALVEAAGPTSDPPMRSRLAAAITRYGSAALMARMVLLFHRSDPATLDEPLLLRHLAALEDSAALPALEAATGRALAPAIREAGDFRARFRKALVAGDRERLLALLGEADRIAALDHASWMEGLRAYSNELARLALPSRPAAPPGGGVHRQMLAAVIFRDRPALEALEAGGFLDDGSDLGLLAHDVLGNRAPLNARLARLYEGSGAAPLVIEGQSAAEVFANAARIVPPAAPPVPPGTGTGTEARAETGNETGAEREVEREVERGTGRGVGAGSKTGLETGLGPWPKVSAIVSAWNPDPALLALSLASLRAQGGVEVEILLVDDASGPEGRAAIDAACAADPAIRLIRLGRNSGPYVGRNLAIERATGAFVAIQDADDWSHPDRFARQVAALREAPQRQLVTAPHIRIDETGRVQMEANFAILGDGPMSAMFRRGTFREVGLFAALRSRGDVEMRERIRHYFGRPALHDLARPMMLCFAAATTLSQRVARDTREDLQLLRAHVDHRAPLGQMRRDGMRFDAAEVVVPRVLRAPDPGPLVCDPGPFDPGPRDPALPGSEPAARREVHR